MTQNDKKPSDPRDPLGFMDRLADAHLASITEEQIDMLRAACTFFQRNQPYSATALGSADCPEPKPAPGERIRQ